MTSETTITLTIAGDLSDQILKDIKKQGADIFSCTHTLEANLKAILKDLIDKREIFVTLVDFKTIPSDILGYEGRPVSQLAENILKINACC